MKWYIENEPTNCVIYDDLNRIVLDVSDPTPGDRATLAAIVALVNAALAYCGGLVGTHAEWNALVAAVDVVEALPTAREE